MALDARIDARINRYRRSASNALGRASERLAVAPPAWQLRQRVGGRWDEIGKLQFDYLVSEGLRPDQAMIDVGCGVLRGGLHFIEYLESGNYYGIDLSTAMIEGARRELEAAELAGKRPNLRATDQFDVAFGRAFDYGLALSVFTHVPLNSVYRALAQIGPQLGAGGRFYATFFPGPDGVERLMPITHPVLPPATEPVLSHDDRNNYHYSPEDFLRIAERLGLRLDVIGDWGHLRGQHMLRFTRP